MLLGIYKYLWVFINVRDVHKYYHFMSLNSFHEFWHNVCVCMYKVVYHKRSKHCISEHLLRAGCVVRRYLRMLQLQSLYYPMLLKEGGGLLFECFDTKVRPPYMLYT